MSRATATNDRMEYLRVQQAQTVRASILDKAVVSVSRLTRETPNHGFVDQHAPEDAFMLAYQMRDYRGDLWVDGRNVALETLRKGTFSFYDYNRSWQANMRSAFDCVNFHVPRVAFDAQEEDLGPHRIGTLVPAPGANIDDQIVRGLVGALLPAFETPETASLLFLDHVGHALCTHLALTYGDRTVRPPTPARGLAPWQLSRACEMMDARLDGTIKVADIAGACRLSPSHFTRAFKLSTGMPPYRWITQRRIERARDLLDSSRLSLQEIALTCGFLDQSHFTRAFTRTVGTSPGRWRHDLRS
ncbi:AraC family transcriptional regulator [Pseudooceanicola sp. CBS1P-1]|uniref:Helix-turn-helix domain-containing protein n=1 Tax=Pseudooceanicola albus TaxID=2692189 RepID=A0A6L7GAI3_9RHOB|nr:MULTISPECIES: AraC family transcriptional regulator [Pseudooceanicola]MBT9386327.1 AraC family transcriptional regulator [Pseudooceanicola endophyticus]MXN20376.1 helix-turn-helix domain-containing protein [Pseudooceanicola albus]